MNLLKRIKSIKSLFLDFWLFWSENTWIIYILVVLWSGLGVYMIVQGELK